MGVRPEVEGGAARSLLTWFTGLSRAQRRTAIPPGFTVASVGAADGALTAAALPARNRPTPLVGPLLAAPAVTAAPVEQTRGAPMPVV